MLKFSVYYPHQKNVRFDMEYYLQKHIPLVKAQMQSEALEKLEIVLGQPGFTGNPPAFIAIANMYFADAVAMKQALKNSGKALAEDLKNYTDITPVQEIAQVVEVS